MAATDISQPIRSSTGSHFIPLIVLNWAKLACNVSLHAQTQASFFTNFHKPYLRSAEEDRLAGGLIRKVTRIGTF